MTVDKDKGCGGKRREDGRRRSSQIARILPPLSRTLPGTFYRDLLVFYNDSLIAEIQYLIRHDTAMQGLYLV
jgi:hypothetical protein